MKASLTVFQSAEYLSNWCDRETGGVRETHLLTKYISATKFSQRFFSLTNSSFLRRPWWGHEITDEYISELLKKTLRSSLLFTNLFLVLDIFGNDVDGKRPKPCLRKLAKELAQTPLSGRETSQQPRTGHWPKLWSVIVKRPSFMTPLS